MKDWSTGASTLQRMALVSAVLALLILLIIALAQVVLALNPYQSVYAQVELMVDNQPDLETHLDYNELAAEYLQPSLDADTAQALADWYDGATELKISSVASEYGDQSAAVRNAIRSMGDLAYAIRRLNNDLQTATNNTATLQNISQVRLYPDRVSPEQLISIHNDGLAEVELINELRSQLQDLASQARQINESTEINQTMAMLQDSLNGADTPDPIALMVKGYTAWQNIPQRCQSLEIQFANTVATLNQIYLAIDGAWRADRNWGYSLWEPAASWVNHSIVWLAVVVMLLIAFMLVGLFRRRPSPVATPPKEPGFNFQRWSQTHITRLIETQNRDSRDPDFWRDARTLLNRLIEAPEEQPVNQARKSAPAAARLVIIQPNGQKKEQPLPDEGIFRIGSDPGFQVPIDYHRAAYVELWIRKARSGYFLEVMFSEEQVLVNNKPINAARALKHGDLIEMKEITIIYLEQ